MKDAGCPSGAYHANQVFRYSSFIDFMAPSVKGDALMFKRVVIAALLAFVVVGLVIFGIDLTRRTGSTDRPEPDEQAANAKLIVYCFHTTEGCETCRHFKDYTRQTLKTHFAGELERGEIVWRAVPYDAPGNEHFIKDFGLVTSMVVLADPRTSHPTPPKSLVGVWDHKNDQTAFMDYIHTEVNAFLKDEAKKGSGTGGPSLRVKPGGIARRRPTPFSRTKCWPLCWPSGSAC